MFSFLQNPSPIPYGIAKGTVTDPSLPAGTGLAADTINVYKVVPLTALNNNIALSQAVTIAQNLVLTPGTGTTLITDPTSVFVGTIALDCPRALQFIVTSGSTPTAANITIRGWTGFGSYIKQVTELLTTTTAVGQFITNHTYLYITSISMSGGINGSISCGTANVIGLPYLLNNVQDVVGLNWYSQSGTATLNGATTVVVTPASVPNGASVAQGNITLARQQIAGTAHPFNLDPAVPATATTFNVIGAAGDTSVVRYTLDYSADCQVIVGDQTSPATITTGDTRGKVILSTPSDGVTPLCVAQRLVQVDSSPITNQSYVVQTTPAYLGPVPFNS